MRGGDQDPLGWRPSPSELGTSQGSLPGASQKHCLDVWLWQGKLKGASEDRS